MAVYPANQCAAIVFSYSISGNRLSCTFHYASSSAMTSAKLLDLNNAFFAALNPILKPVVAVQVTFEQTYCYCLAPNMCRTAVGAFVSEHGSVAFDAVPSNIALVFLLRQTDKASRHNGRLFLSGIGENIVINGRVANGPMSLQIEDLRAFIAADLPGSLDTYKPITVQRYDAGAPITPVGLSVSQVNVFNNLGTQRRRTTELRQLHA